MKSWQSLKPVLIKALTDAFTEVSFKQMLEFCCQKNLDHLVADKIPFPQKVYEVVNNATREGWLARLATCAYEANKSHTVLQEITSNILAGIASSGSAFYQIPLYSQGEAVAVSVTQINDELKLNYNLSEFEELCLYLSVNPEDLGGRSRSDKMRELVLYCQRHGLLAELQENMRKHDQVAVQKGILAETPKEGIDPSANELDKWVEMLVTCATMINRDRRDDVVRDLPVYIQGNIERRTNLYDDVYNITRTCMEYNDGMLKLVATIKKREGTAKCMQNLEIFLQK